MEIIYTNLFIWLASFFLAVFLTIFFRLFRALLGATKQTAAFVFSLFPKMGFGFFFRWGVLCVMLSFFRFQIIDFCQYMYQYYYSPVYVGQWEGADKLDIEQRFLDALKKNVTRREYDILMAHTDSLAARHGSTVMAFLQVYNSECGLNPFAVNVETRENGSVDTVAAGQIQFTATGVKELTVNGENVTMRRVKNAINSRNIRYLCDASNAYFANINRALPRPCDVYTAVFMPAFVGKTDDTVIASKFSDKPQYYYRNTGLDGYKVKNGVVLYSDAYKDGKITIGELGLRLAYKAAKLKQ